MEPSWDVEEWAKRVWRIEPRRADGDTALDADAARDTVFSMADMLGEVASHLSPQEAAKLLLAQKMTHAQADRLFGRVSYWDEQFERRFRDTPVGALWRWYDQEIASGQLQRLADKYSPALGDALQRMLALPPARRRMSSYFAAEACMLAGTTSGFFDWLAEFVRTRNVGAADILEIGAEAFNALKSLQPVRTVRISASTLDTTLEHLDEKTSSAHTTPALKTALIHFALDAVRGRYGPNAYRDVASVPPSLRKRPSCVITTQDVYGPYSAQQAIDALVVLRKHAFTTEEAAVMDASGGNDFEWKALRVLRREAGTHVRFEVGTVYTTHFSWLKTTTDRGIIYTAKRSVWFHYVPWPTLWTGLQYTTVAQETWLYSMNVTKFLYTSKLDDMLQVVVIRGTRDTKSIPVAAWSESYRAILTAAGVSLPVGEHNISEAWDTVLAFHRDAVTQTVPDLIETLAAVPSLVLLIDDARAVNHTRIPRLFASPSLSSCVQCGGEPTHVDPAARLAYCAACAAAPNH